MIRSIIDIIKDIVLRVIKEIIPSKAEELNMLNEDSEQKMMMNEKLKCNQCDYDNLSPIKNDNNESPWSKSVINCFTTLNNQEKDKVKKFNDNNIKSINPFNNNYSENQIVQCPKCLYEIKLIDSFNLITCISPFNCKCKIKFCRQCKMILNKENEINHFKHGYYMPICAIAKLKSFN